ncbi:hypothetical protein [Candidatus Nitrospira bockiana]
MGKGHTGRPGIAESATERGRVHGAAWRAGRPPSACELNRGGTDDHGGVRAWRWLIRYGTALLLAFCFATILGNVALFKSTPLADTRLRASHLVEFAGYGGALLFLWLMGCRMRNQIARDPDGISSLHHVVLPVITLVILAAGYEVVLLLAEPFLSRTGKLVYNWVFIAGITAAALWMTLAWFLKSGPSLESWDRHRRDRGRE